MLTVRGLTKTYATADGSFQALKGIDFEVPAGGFYTLLVLSVNLFGDWLRDRLDPRLRQL